MPISRIWTRGASAAVAIPAVPKTATPSSKAGSRVVFMWMSLRGGWAGVPVLEAEVRTQQAGEQHQVARLEQRHDAGEIAYGHGRTGQQAATVGGFMPCQAQVTP